MQHAKTQIYHSVCDIYGQSCFSYATLVIENCQRFHSDLTARAFFEVYHIESES